MSKPTERRFRNKVEPKLRGLPKSWWTSVQQVAIRGTPDIIGVVNGRMVALEFKRDELQVPTRLQQLNIDRINKAGGFAAIVHPKNWGDIWMKLVKLSSGD